ncbi:MAG: pantoate--beta-alanine ligase [Planctomycetaceae bacterium]
MIVTEQIDEVRRQVAAARGRRLSIGLVPTMGALHEGHLSLIRAARDECGFVVVTIFVNPTQFGPSEDFTRYPRPIEQDLELCRAAGADLVFQPDAKAIYPDGFATFVDVGGISSVLEGAHRPGHFRGVATVVLKLFNIVSADVAYFGRKDYQQQLLIRTMCRELDLPMTIRTCPTVREPDGLALSSRNRYLSATDRKTALGLSQSLRLAEEQLRGGATDVVAVRKSMRAHLEALPGVVVDYATVADPETLEELEKPRDEMVALVAARVGNTRLIDNLPISLRDGNGRKS